MEKHYCWWANDNCSCTKIKRAIYMDELDKRIFVLKQEIRQAANKSQLPPVIIENILDAIKSEAMQQNMYLIMSKQMTEAKDEPCTD